MKGWLEANMYGKEEITRDLREACKRLLEAFDSTGPCDCGGSSLCAICAAQEAVARADGAYPDCHEVKAEGESHR